MTCRMGLSNDCVNVLAAEQYFGTQYIGTQYFGTQYFGTWTFGTQYFGTLCKLALQSR